MSTGFNMERGFNALGGLSTIDQIKFNAFGRGPRKSHPISLLHHGFENNATRQPSVIAVVQHADGTSITYGELERRANILANKLIQHGLMPRERVLLVLQRSIEMTIAILAVLKAGCQYVPLDAGIVPEDTLRHVLHDTQARLVLCSEKFTSKVLRVARDTTSILALDTPMLQNLYAQDEGGHRPPPRILSPKDGAYIIYTSGTTGKPKGVDVSHENLINVLCLEPGNLKISTGTKVAQLLNIAFDMAAWEILGTLVNGGTLCLRGSDWDRTLKQVDTVIMTPSILGRFSKTDYPNITTIAVGGEPCPKKLADTWAIGTSFHNICGPTEITILNTLYNHHPERNIDAPKALPLCIGSPIPNTNVYILDKQQCPVPIGAVGLMWVGGLGVSRGYLNLPELSNARFLPDKFSGDGKTMFNTGDLCRWCEDGTIEHHGREDNQIKYKGFRIELDGVSAAVELYPTITKACTLIVEDQLKTYYSSNEEVDATALREHNQKYLPYYAVPGIYIHVQSIPLTSNGKVDKRALQEIHLEPGIVAAAPTPPKDHRRDSFANDEKSTDNMEPLTVTIPPQAWLSSKRDSFDNLEKGLYIPDKPIVAVKEVPETPSTAVTLPKECTLPNKTGFHGERWLRHRFFSLYRRLFSIVLVANIAMLLYVAYRSWKFGIKLEDLAIATSVNLLVSVLMRQDHVVNLLFTIVTSVPTWTPLCIRRNLAKVYHIGGIHSGAAVAAVFWFIAFTISASRYLIVGSAEYPVSIPALVCTYLIVLLFLLILAMAHPKVRAKYHNQFELSHRFFGWTALLLLWAQTVLVADSLRGNAPLGRALLQNPSMWMLAVATASIIYPWLLLRKVKVRPEPLSDRAIRLHFDYCDTYPGTAVRISYSPLKEWHGFATIAKPGVKGFSLVVSKAGDWTGNTIERMPTTAWKKGVPACGVLAIAPLFKKVVLVATGSGIGPCLPVIMAKKVPCRVLWSTPRPEATYGQEIIEAVRDCDPNALIIDTKAQKERPNLAALAYQLYRESDAEAVAIISNAAVTEKFVYDMEARGIPAYGAIFDS